MTRLSAIPMDPAGGKTPVTAIREFMAQLLERDIVDAVLTPARTPYSPLPMPTLITDPARLDTADPLAPAAPFNAARQAAAATRRSVGKHLAAFLRPCEVHAWIELAKLHQCVPDQLLLLSFDCPGRMENETYLDLANRHEDLTTEFLRSEDLQGQITTACQVCRRFTPDNADLVIRTLPVPEKELVVEAHSDAGGKVMADLGYPSAKGAETTPPERQGRDDKRKTRREAVLTEMADRIRHVDQLQELLANCLNCYNCRTACPVCYCRECVFLTDVFTHDPEIYWRRAEKKGRVKLPTETTMFHLTRLSHMAHACVGCGQCSSVCPSHIPVADLFITVADRIQQGLDYFPGRDPKQPIPSLAYKETQT